MYYTRSVCVTTSARGFLAVWAKVGAALADGDFFDCGAAAPAGLTGATIRLKVILLRAFGTVAIAIIPEGAAAVFDLPLLSSEERTIILNDWSIFCHDSYSYSDWDVINVKTQRKQNFLQVRNISYLQEISSAFEPNQPRLREEQIDNQGLSIWNRIADSKCV